MCEQCIRSAASAIVVAAFFWPTGDFAQEPSKSKANSSAGRDSTVLEVVLADFLTMPEFVDRDARGKPHIFFSLERPRYEPNAKEIVEPVDPKQWAKLSEIQLDCARQASLGLVRRLEEKDVYKGFTPKDDRIVIWSEPRVDAKRFPRMAPWYAPVLRAHAPGYSRDGRIAVLHVRFRLDLHSGSATYVLSRKEDKWVVLVRDVGWFL